MVSAWIGEWFFVAAETAEGGGGPLDFIKENNLVNFLIVAGLLFYVGKGFLSKLLGERRQNIKEEIDEVETRAKAAEQELIRQKQNLAQAQTEAANIKARALENAKRVREEILAQIDGEIARMRQESQKEMEAGRERVVSQLRIIALERTFQKVESELPSLLNDDIHRNLIDEGLMLLDRGG
ncbi:F0F1 ATP synthase subunit B [Anthocerotibacter panamensis]|uniref:F0F1 ATP synthase subunit B n=1 Tax=Anthocerotibacter panamensis TaxID=2857077 RepID=UPI001C402609|nr:F0F1 ATP synthase subunit B [Anthocerotibacter panamensis]